METNRFGSATLLVQVDLEKLLCRIERSRCNENLKDFAFDVITRTQDVIDSEKMIGAVHCA